MTEQPVITASGGGSAKPEIVRDLVGLGFLAGSDCGNPDAVLEATDRLLREATKLFQDLASLFASLREAKLRFDGQDNSGRHGALYALDAVLRYLMLFEAVHVENLLTPLALLFGDLESLDGGQVRPMVAPVKKRGGARASGFYNTLKGIAVFTVRRLEASGMARPDARQAVAMKLAKSGVRPARKGSREGSGELSERTIKKWQEEIDADISVKTIAAQELRLCEEGQVRRVLEMFGLAHLPEGSTADDLELSRVGRREFQRGHLTRLAQFALETRLGPQKST